MPIRSCLKKDDAALPVVLRHGQRGSRHLRGQHPDHAGLRRRRVLRLAHGAHPRPKAGENPTPFWDLNAMRTANELVLRVPRVGFFSTPAFFANWPTNTANQARVTMNQTLIVALGRSFDDSNNTVPVTSPALDAKHASEPACYACHKTLDPMRQVFRQAFTFMGHEQKDPAQVSLPGVFAFDGVTRPISSPKELGEAMASHPRFAIAWTQKLCYWANSAPCLEAIPNSCVAQVFEKSGFSWPRLVRELCPRRS